jgi:hypothetical protein
MKRFLISLFCLSLSQALWSAEISFEVTTKSILDIYKELVQLQTLPPQTTKSINDALEVWPEFHDQFRKLAINAKTEGFTRQYNRYLLADSEHFIYKFIETENLRWIAYFQKNCGFGEPLSYDDKIDVHPNSSKFPGKGSALICKESFPAGNQQWVERTVTIYSILVGLIEAIDRLDRDKISTVGTENFNRFVRTLKNNIEKAIEISAEEKSAFCAILSCAKDNVKEIQNKRCLECGEKASYTEKCMEADYEKQCEKNKLDFEAQIQEITKQYELNIIQLKEQHEALLARIKKNRADSCEKINKQAAELIEELDNRIYLSKEGAAGLVEGMKTGQ